MGSLEKNLLPGEEVLYRARLSSLPLVIDIAVLLLGLGLVIGGLVMLAVPVAGFAMIGIGGIALLVGCGRLVRTMVQRSTTDMVITTRRVLSRVGVLRKESEEMFLGKIESVEVQQNLWARVMNYGTIEVNGSGEGELLFPNVQSPHEFRKACMGAVEQAQTPRAGVHAAPTIAANGVVFEVQVQDAPGTPARWIEVRAENAERAKALAAAAGVRTGEARLKRIG
ncbi:MAG TPA: PH domain-containing protein [Phycisphaerales bacterium]|nr:PH domain-containing protein [Phycisphaerales bacterium]